MSVPVFAEEVPEQKQPDISETVPMAVAMKGKEYDRLYLAGRLQDSSVGIGVDLKTFEVAVTVPRGCREMIGKLSQAVTQPFAEAF